MQTSFTPEQLADPATAVAAHAIRTCVHCGFCATTCPTYTLLGDERDSPRGRIYLMKDMLENQRQPSAEVVTHIDRCLSCLACMTACPSGVNYMHLVDHARAYIAEHHQRAWPDRLIRQLLAAVLPYPKRFRAAVQLARLARPFAPVLARWTALKPLAAMLALAPRQLPRPATLPAPAMAGPKGRIAVLQGCAEPVLRPAIRAATVELLARLGYGVVFASGEGCCGALVHHMGREADARAAARRNVDAWTREIDNGGLNGILITTSGCGTSIRTYGFMLRDDPAYAAKAARVSALAMDISQLLGVLDIPACPPNQITVAYHAACSLQHGAKITDAPKKLLAAAGFTVRTPMESHLCCGSAGTYNILQSDIAAQLRDRKVAHINKLNADVIASGNIGCAVQIGQTAPIPVVHTIELLNWATGGTRPAELEHLGTLPAG